MHPLVIYCLSAPNPPSLALLCDPSAEPYKHFSFAGRCRTLWESQEEAGASHSGSRILLLFVCLLLLLGMTWQCCVETEWCPPSCGSHWYPCRQFPAHQPPRASPRQTSWPSSGLQSPSVTGLNLSLGREGLLQVCSFSGARVLCLSLEASSYLCFLLP